MTTAIAPYYSQRFLTDSRGDQYAPGGHLLIAAGTGDDWPGGLPGDYLDLSAGPGAYEASTPDFDKAISDTGRTIEIELRIWGDSPDDLWQNVDAIERWLKRAREASTAQGGGLPVCLWVKMMTSRDASLHTSEWVYFDVVSGHLLLTVKLDEEFKETPIRRGMLTLNCRQFARGDTIPGTWSGTLTAGIGCTLYIPNVPGDAPALPKLTAEDLSTTGRWTSLRTWRRAYDGMADADWACGYEVAAQSPTVIWLYRTSGTAAGTFTLTFGANTTAAQAYNVSAASLQTALQGLASIGSGKATVTGTGTGGDPYVVTFAGSLAAAPQASFTIALTGWTASNSLIQARQTGLALNDATASGGATAEMSLSSTYLPIGVAASTGAALNNGRMALLARMRTSIAGPPTPTLTAMPTAAGSGSYFAPLQNLTLRGSVFNAGGAESAASLQQVFYLSQPSIVYVTIDSGTFVASKFRAYWLEASTSVWKYLDHTVTATSYTFTLDSTGGYSAGGYGGLNIAASVPPIVVASVALDTANPQYQSGGPVSMPAVANSWALLPLGTFHLPPTGLPQGVALPWRALLSAQALNGAPLIDADIILTVPHEAEASYVGVAVADDPVPVQRYWVITHRPDGRTTALIYRSSDNALLGQADAVSQLTLEPGSNKLLFVPENVDGSFDVIGSKLRVKCDITPRYRHAGRPAW